METGLKVEGDAHGKCVERKGTAFCVEKFHSAQHLLSERSQQQVPAEE